MHDFKLICVSSRSYLKDMTLADKIFQLNTIPMDKASFAVQGAQSDQESAKIEPSDDGQASYGLPVPDYFLIREKDLDSEAYCRLIGQIINRCGEEIRDKLIIHTFAEACLRYDIDRLHLPMKAFTQFKNNILSEDRYHGSGNLSYEWPVNDSAFHKLKFTELRLSVSVHSPEEAHEASDLGAHFVTFGNIFETSCKPGLAGRGLEALIETVNMAHCPVYAIGGINADDLPEIKETGAAGACIMSGYMDADKFLEPIKKVVVDYV
jgi:thiamine monophosphate synthase